jgi:sulfite exporter TauE/SafE/copper chaperone CopZ
MENKFITITLNIKGMTCASCESRIERALKNTSGVANAIVNFGKGTALVTYDPERIDIERISKIIRDIGYESTAASAPGQGTADSAPLNGIRTVGVLVILFALYVIISRFGGFNLLNSYPQAKAGMGYGMLFAIGLLTSTHCIAMCGGINLSQCAPVQKSAFSGSFSVLKPSLLYNAGRVISYTMIGGLVGALGSAVSFSPAGKGAIAVIAGVFMVIMGLNMLDVFPWLKRFNPKIPKIFAVKINDRKRNGTPFYVGILNGLMPCGPLQAMQLFALSTGDPFKGALSMLVFSLGTVPLMFGLGALSTVLTKRFTSKMMTISASLVVILGLFMLGNGMALTGYALPLSSESGSSLSSGQEASPSSAADENGMATAILKDGVQEVTSTMDAGSYEPIAVQKGIPVRWTIHAEAADINGCNGSIVIPEYGVEKQLEPGDNVIEFTPDKSGTIGFSCWMGMIRSQIAVVDDLQDPGSIPEQAPVYNNNLPSCCGGSTPNSSTSGI